LFSGTSWSRKVSFGACSDTASAEPVHHRHDARRGHRDAPARQAVGVVVEHEPQRRHERIVVEQRLAHAHHDDVGDDALALARYGAGRRLAQRELGHAQLADDLARRQVARKTLLARGAKTAVDRAARLRRHAKRTARFLGNENGLDRIPVADVDEPLARAVGRNVIADDGRHGDRRAALELFAQRLREIGHAIEVRSVVLMDPTLQLLGAKRLLAQAVAIGDETCGVEIEKVDG
jgi:hypothetical protein